MIAERVVSAALLAYPKDVRESLGNEMLGTVLDASNGSSWRVLSESVALIRSGLRTRASITIAAGPRQFAAAVCAQAATVWGLFLLISLLRFDRVIMASNGVLDHEVDLISIQALIAMSVAVALLGYDRISALFGLAWIGVELQEALSAPRWLSTGMTHTIAILLIPLACYGIMLLCPRTRRRDARRLMWLAAVVFVGFAPSLGSTNFGYGLGLEGMMLVVLLAAGVFLLPVGSTLPLAFALALIAYGLSLWTRPGGFAVTELHAVRWAMTTAGPLLLISGTALRLVSARRLAD